MRHFKFLSLYKIAFVVVILFYLCGTAGAFFWSSLAERALEQMFNAPVGTNGNGGRFISSTGGLLFKSARAAGCTTGAVAGNTCTTTVTWPTAYADTTYSATCGCNTATQIPVLSFTKAAGTLTVTTTTAIAAASSCGTIECMALHD